MPERIGHHMRTREPSVTLFDELIEHEHIKKTKAYDVCWKDSSGRCMIRKFDGGEEGYKAAHHFSHTVNGVVYER